MENRFELDDHTVNINGGTHAAVVCYINYEPLWENGDYDYAGTHCTHGIGGTRRVGLELTEVTITSVDIRSYAMFSKRAGEWMETAYIDNEKLDNGGNKDFIQWLEANIMSDSAVIEAAEKDADAQGVPERDYDC